jgi:hypothetical protein
MFHFQNTAYLNDIYILHQYESFVRHAMFYKTDINVLFKTACKAVEFGCTIQRNSFNNFGDKICRWIGLPIMSLLYGLHTKNI